MSTIPLTEQKIRYRKTGESWNEVTISPTNKIGSHLVSPADNNELYEVEMTVKNEHGISVTTPVHDVMPSELTTTPTAPDNPAYMDWYNEVPFYPDQDGFRQYFEAQLTNDVGYNPAVVNITNFNNYDTNNARSAMNNAIDSLPSGGTLLIPEGVTIRLNNYMISKNIRIDCRGTIKRCDYGVEGTSSSYIIALNANCLWDGGTIDANRESWGPNNALARATLIRVDQPCVVKNVHGVNICNREDHISMQWGGFEIGAQAYFESVICERNGGRPFNCPNIGGMNADGTINIYRGRYFYKCEARDNERKGFGTGGNAGFFVLDDCKWNGRWFRDINDPASYDANGNPRNLPESQYILETGHNVGGVGNYNHTAIIKNCTVDSYHHSKSDGYKYVMFIGCNIRQWKQGSGFRIDVCGVSTCTVTADSNYYLDTTLIAHNSFFESYIHDDGRHPVLSASGQRFPLNEININASFKTGRFFFTGCHFKYDRFVHS